MKKKNMEIQKEMEFYKIIKIPHLRYTIYLQDLSKLKGIPIKSSAYTIPYGDYGSIVFVDDIKNTFEITENIALMAHEFLHIIQNICELYGFDITQEREHTAYLMSYLLEETFNLTLNPESISNI